MRRVPRYTAIVSSSDFSLYIQYISTLVYRRIINALRIQKSNLAPGAIIPSEPGEKTKSRSARRGGFGESIFPNKIWMRDLRMGHRGAYDSRSDIGRRKLRTKYVFVPSPIVEGVRVRKKNTHKDTTRTRDERCFVRSTRGGVKK